MARVLAVMERLIALHEPELVVIACNTASTLVLPASAGAFRDPVRRHRPGDQAGRAGDALGADHGAGDARHRGAGLYPRPDRDLCGRAAGSISSAPRGWPAIAEAELAGDPVPDARSGAEIAPCFVEDGGGRTDVVALACTHYPLLLPRLSALRSWPVTWIDPAPAIARRVVQLIGGPVLGSRGGGRRGLGRVHGWRRAHGPTATRLAETRPAADRRRGDAARPR